MISNSELKEIEEWANAVTEGLAAFGLNYVCVPRLIAEIRSHRKWMDEAMEWLSLCVGYLSNKGMSSASLDEMTAFINSNPIANSEKEEEKEK